MKCKKWNEKKYENQIDPKCLAECEAKSLCEKFVEWCTRGNIGVSNVLILLQMQKGLMIEACASSQMVCESLLKLRNDQLELRVK